MADSDKNPNGLKSTSMGRDQFAALAMQGLISSPSSTCTQLKINDGEIEKLASDSYRIADAMVAARSGKTAAK